MYLEHGDADCGWVGEYDTREHAIEDMRRNGVPEGFVAEADAERLVEGVEIEFLGSKEWVEFSELPEGLT